VFAESAGEVPDRDEASVATEVIDVPVGTGGAAAMVCDAGPEATGPEGRADVDVPAGVQAKRTEAAYGNPTIYRRGE
jgi:hypothetical protein